MTSDEVATGKEQIPEVYKGLDPYSVADADKFFGRTKDIQQIINSLLTRRLTVLYGDSGVGKTSVLRAGVTHALRKEAKQNMEDCRVPKLAVVIFPSLEGNWQEDPLKSLTKQIEEEITEEMGNIFFPIKPPKPELSFVEMLEAWAKVLGGEDFDGWLLIILDQFEEYFQYHSPEEPGVGFIAEVAKVLKQLNLNVNFLISLREDFYVDLNRLREAIPRIFDISLHIEHLEKKKAREAIIKPLEEYNKKVTLEQPVDIDREKLVPALLEAIPQVKITEITSEDAQGGREKVQSEWENKIFAPYLQLVMTRLWKEMKNNSLTLQTLTNLGDKDAEDEETKIQSAIKNIIYQHLSSVLEDQELSDRDREILAKSFQYLVTPSGTKQAYYITDLANYIKCETQKLEVLEKLSKGKQRIIRRISPSLGQPPRYEIFHDFLASAVLKWQKKYIDKREREEREEREKIERKKQRQKKITIVSVFTLAFLYLFYWFWVKKYQVNLKRLTEQAESAEESFNQGEQLTALQQLVQIGRQVKNNIFISEPITSKFLFSSNDRETLNAKVTRTFQKILNKIQEQNKISPKIFPKNGSESDLFFLSPDGQTLAIFSIDKTVQPIDGTVRLRDWQNQQDQDLDQFEVSSKVLSLSFSPVDGKTLTTASTKDNSVFIERRTVYGSLKDMLTQSCEWLKPYLESRPDEKKELGCL